MRLLFFLCFGLAVGAFTQVPAPAVAQRPVSEIQWEKAAADLDYSKDVPKPKKERPKPTNPMPEIDAGFWGNIAQILAIMLAVLAIGYGIYRMMQEPRNRRIARDGAEITEENLEAYLHETDLERFLREALARGDFPQALRIYYLQVIKSLSESGLILWSREKTNRDYLREMRAHPLSPDFHNVTRVFERVWYGNLPLDSAGFAHLEPAFKTMLAQIPPPYPQG